MTTPRVFHTATLLPGGHVLIAGGRTTDNSVLPSAELYNTSNGTFSVTGQIPMPRVAHTATLLADGRVLIASGAESPSAELYDPETGTFNAAGDYATPAGLMTATRLADGRVLLTGCNPNCGSDGYTDIAQLYDPATDTFSSTGSTGAAFGQTETPLPNGKVLFAGGVATMVTRIATRNFTTPPAPHSPLQST